MTFHVGQKVVCLPAPWMLIPVPPWVCPEVWNIYTLREILPWPNTLGSSCRLLEIKNEMIHNFEPAFSIQYFRPLVEKKTDISVFTAMLTPNKECV